MSLPVSVIAQFLRPPLATCSLEALPGNPYAAPVTGLQRISGPIGVNAMGFRYVVHSATAGYGNVTIGGLARYSVDVAIVQVVTGMHDGSFIIDQSLESKLSTEFFMFNESFPDHVDVWMPPGVTLDLFWVLLKLP